ncbi:MAG: OmpA family protein [Luteolibacter sp.]
MSAGSIQFAISSLVRPLWREWVRNSGGRMFLTGLAFLLAACPWAAAQQDAKGLRDHRVIGRFEGAVIVAGETKKFDERVIQTGKLGGNEEALGGENSMRRSGAVTSLVYDAPKESSAVEIAANYRARLEALEYKMVYECDTFGSGDFGPVNRVVKLTFGQPAWGAWSFRGGYAGKPRYLLMEKGEGGGRSTVALVVGEAGIAGDAPRYALLVVDEAAMKTDQITVPTPQEMVDAFKAKGSMALYGIYFDTGASVMKSESKPTLEVIAELLGQQSKLELIVVGHTDNVGDFAANMKLSQARAAAVVVALTREYKVAGGRLRAFGAGMAAPAAPNTSDKERARNRRVELVPR